ncbi:Ribulose bisphosphate carboxylase-like protein 2 [compost metagenome]
MPVFSSGQWAATLARTMEAAGAPDFMFLAGGGILAHPHGPAAGVASLRQAYDALCSNVDLKTYAAAHPALEAALDFYGTRG